MNDLERRVERLEEKAKRLPPAIVLFDPTAEEIETAKSKTEHLFVVKFV
ncbi:MAG: hypothetical protein HQL51_05870 [Magnetococcales bacterium]|nr:hypothetical protein [Magnetococcales bacterium]